MQKRNKNLNLTTERLVITEILKVKVYGNSIPAATSRNPKKPAVAPTKDVLQLLKLRVSWPENNGNFNLFSSNFIDLVVAIKAQYAS